ncbi:MAG TPA: DoxX family membrane protein [Flavobacterium sp.]|uniref:DoxX family membrane protein n=1 Tax=unclassified Flavobacterium TaxID=196869 RepID=UPI000CC4A0FD|nr:MULTISPECIES: DoxX family membrane protein [unclassified Flavobacterium]PKP19312.1 MAG: DoxX protein [Bacteroidetes bacterium HGW-Bacteroidetes-23]HRE77668.1 DoxX family membrane protein [Flavobacterium sp.]
MNSQFTKLMRILLGVILVVFGLNKFLNFIPAPELPENAANFIDSLASTGYVLQVVGVIEILIGLLLLFNKWVAFALVVLVPISVNILLFHLFLDIPGISGALLVTVFNGILMYKLWPKYKPLFN